MLICIPKPSLFISQRMLNQAAAAARLKSLHRKRWCFIATAEVPFKRLEDVLVMKLGSLFKMHPEEFKSLLIEKLETDKRITGVRVNDGVIAHPEAVARVIGKMTKKLVEEM